MARHPFAILANELWPVYRTSFRRVSFDGPDNVFTERYVRSVYLSDPRDREDAHFIVLPSTGGPDVFGTDLIAESNYRSLIRDFGEDAFITLAYMNRDDLMVPILPGDGWDDESDEYATANHLADVVRALFDYPLYDESDHSEMEFADVESSWDAYMSRDVQHEIEKRVRLMADEHPDETFDIDALEEAFTDWIDAHPEEFRDIWWEIRSLSDYPWEHDGNSPIFPDWETETVPEMISRIRVILGIPEF